MLDVAKLETFYGASQALFGVDLQVGEGQMVALLGRNGMGKTTTLRSICGLTPARKGSIVYRGEDIRGLPAFKVARRGIGLVPEGRRCFPNLTVRENLVATARGEGWDMAGVTARTKHHAAPAWWNSWKTSEPGGWS
jgi:branched-chain amino acid transport system ATP-binding protein